MTQNVRDVMTREVETARPDMSVKEAAGILKAKDIGSLPVVDGKRVIGVITDRDITIRAVAEGRDPATTKVEEVVSKEVVSVREDARLEDAERVMHDKQLRRLPVVNENGELVGYLPLAKVARAESLERAGKVIKGVSQPSQPEPMGTQDTKRRRKKTG
jgi:CBS domain-containing protein